MIRFVLPHRVRYRECDPMGVVYHTHYLDLFEAARTEALRAQGLAYRALEAQGVMTPVVEAHVRYRRPALYDDLLDVEVTFAEPQGTRVTTEYAVRRQGEADALATGRVVLCFVDAASRRPIPAPPAVLAAFAAAP